MPSPTQQSQALLRIVSLVLAVFLFITMTEQDARHDTHQRWLAEARRRQEAGTLADTTPANRFACDTDRTCGSYGRMATTDRLTRQPTTMAGQFDRDRR